MKWLVKYFFLHIPLSIGIWPDLLKKRRKSELKIAEVRTSIEQASNKGYTTDIEKIYNLRRKDIQRIINCLYYVKSQTINH